MENLTLRSEAKLIPLPQFDRLVDNFILNQDVKQSSRDTYRKTLKPFLAWIRDKNFSTITRQDILEYKEYLQSQNISSLTLSSYLVTVRKFFEWLESMKYYPNVAKGIKGAKRDRNFRKDTLTVSQVKELLNGMDTITIQGKRDYALLNLLIRTGLRTIEVIRSDVGDIRQEGGEAVLWIQGKGRDSKDEFVLLTDETLKPINEYLRARGKVKDIEPLFASMSDRNRNGRLTTRTVRRIVKDYFRGIGLESLRLSAHSLRHTAITLSLQGGATIQEAQALGRHANINTTMIYAHNINRITNAPERKIDKMLAEIN